MVESKRRQGINTEPSGIAGVVGALGRYGVFVGKAHEYDTYRSPTGVATNTRGCAEFNQFDVVDASFLLQFAIGGGIDGGIVEIEKAARQCPTTFKGLVAARYQQHLAA